LLYNPTEYRVTFLKDPRQYRVWSYLIYTAAIYFYSFLGCGIFCLWINQKSIPSNVLIPSFLGCGVCFIGQLSQNVEKLRATSSIRHLHLRKTIRKDIQKRNQGTAVILTVATSGVIPALYSLTESFTSYFIYNAVTFKTMFAILPILISLIRKLILQIIVFEFCIIGFGTIISLILIVKVGHLILCEYCKLGKKAMRQCNIISFMHYYNSYIAVMIFLRVAEITFAALTTVLMSGGMFGVVCSNYVTIKMQSTIPMPYYLFFPIVSIVILSLISASLTQGGKVYEQSVTLIQEWNKECSIYTGPNSSYLRRKMKCLKALDFPVGIGGTHLFWINQNTRRLCYRAIGDSTLDMLLTF